MWLRLLLIAFVICVMLAYAGFWITCAVLAVCFITSFDNDYKN
jgi:hypothetical protein